MLRVFSAMIVVVLVAILAVLTIPRFNSAISTANAKDVLGKIYAAQKECKTENGFYSSYPEAGQGLIFEAMNESGFDFIIEKTDSSFTAYAGRYVLPNDLLINSNEEFVPLFSIDQDSIFREISR